VLEEHKTEVEALRRRCEELKRQLDASDRCQPKVDSRCQPMAIDFDLDQTRHDKEVRGLQQSLQNLQDRLQVCSTCDVVTWVSTMRIYYYSSALYGR
jgi:predicted RNase H-like nuclease (RuvC/YqgF family)